MADITVPSRGWVWVWVISIWCGLFFWSKIWCGSNEHCSFTKNKGHCSGLIRNWALKYIEPGPWAILQVVLDFRDQDATTNFFSGGNMTVDNDIICLRKIVEYRHPPAID